MDAAKPTYEQLEQECIMLREQLALLQNQTQGFAEQLIDITPTLIYIYDLEENVNVYSNKALERLLDYSQQEITDMGANLFATLIHPDDLMKIVENHQRLAHINDNEVLEIEFRFRHRNGEWRILHSWDTVFARNKQGGVKQIAGSVLDVTERRNNEILLHQSEGRFKAIFEQAAIGVAQINSNTGEFIHINQKYCDIVGYTVQELLGGRFQEITHADDLEEDLNNMQLLIEGKIRSYSMEKRYWHKNGSIVWVQLTVSAMWDQGETPDFHIAVVEDITARKKAEIAQKISDMRLRANLENTPNVAVQWYDQEGRVLYWNPASEKLYGWTSEESIGKTLDQLIQTPEEAALFLALLKEIKTTGVPYGPYESPIHNRDGKEGWVLATTFSIPMNEDTSIFVCTDVDITQQKRVEAELISAKEHAEESDRLKTAFLQNISHEIRTPMNAIIGFADMLNDSELSTDQRKEYTSIVVNSSNQLLSIVNDILTISAIDTNQEHVNISPILLNATLKDLYNIFKLQVAAKNIRLQIHAELTDEQSEIYSDRTKLIQVLTNLLTNALKFTHEGSIEFGYTIKNNEINFFVSDTGIGIPPDMHHKIFERFRQVQTSRNREYGGTGLGLAICKAFVELLGGTIYVESELQKGSSFHFTIPYNPVNVIVKPVNIVQKPLILVAEDEEYNFLYIEAVLRKMDVEIIHAKNGAEAIELCSNHNFSLILMDIKMPILDGHSAALQIKTTHPYLPIVAQTAYALDHEIDRYSHDGFDDYITKPINRKILIDKINLYIKTNN